MKGITTIAALPSGSGCAAALPAEVGEAKPVLMGVDMASGPDTSVINIIAKELALAFAKKVDREIMAQFKPFSTITPINPASVVPPCGQCKHWKGRGRCEGEAQFHDFSCMVPKTFSPDDVITSDDTGLWLLPDIDADLLDTSPGSTAAFAAMAAACMGEKGD